MYRVPSSSPLSSYYQHNRKRTRRSKAVIAPPPPPPPHPYYFPFGTGPTISPHLYATQQSYPSTTPDTYTTSPQPYYYYPRSSEVYPPCPDSENDHNSTDDSDHSMSNSQKDMHSVKKDLLMELRKVQRFTEELSTRQKNLEQKLIQYLNDPSPSTHTKPPSSTSSSNSTTHTDTTVARKSTTGRKMETRSMINKNQSIVTTPLVSQKFYKKKNPFKKPVRRSVKREDIIKVIASQPGYRHLKNTNKGYEKLLNLAQDEMASMQKAVGTPGVSTTTFGNEEIQSHRINARDSICRSAKTKINPAIDLTSCPWAADYVLRRSWESAHYQFKKSQRNVSNNGNNVESDDESADNNENSDHTEDHASDNDIDNQKSDDHQESNEEDEEQRFSRCRRVPMVVPET